MSGQPACLPPTVKPKSYRDEVKRRFCEALLARRVLIVEGRTEYDTASRIARKLQELEPHKYASLERLGIAVISADTDSQVAPLGEYFRRLGKTTYAIFDKQNSESESAAVCNSVDYPYESQEKGFENVVLKGVNETILRKYVKELADDGLWPSHIEKINSDTPLSQLQERLGKYFKHNKAGSSIANCLCMCSINEMPKYILDTMQAIRNTIMPSPSAGETIDDSAAE